MIATSSPVMASMSATATPVLNSKPLPKLEIASTWELRISSSSSDDKVPSEEIGEVEVDRSISRRC